MDKPLPVNQPTESQAMPPEQPGAELLADETLSHTMASRPSQQTHKATKTPPAQLIWGGAAVLAILVVSLWLALHPEWVEGLGRWGYLGAFLISLIASATIILPAPGIAVVVAMGVALDPLLLGIVAGLGSAIGELSGYVAGASGRALVPEHQRAQVERLRELTGRYGPALLAVLAALPLPLFDFAGIVAGMIRMPILAFLVAVSVGKSIKYVILIVAGAGPLIFLQQLAQMWSGGQ
ncbi:MAG TPA: VTT domain-containing protein [Caldilineaceae bacterium]|nr:VTT domain-containing protein [Caldilineaceae bacterium]